MSCSGLANVLSGVALILRTSSGPTFRVDHTVIAAGHHRLSIGTITVASRMIATGRPRRVPLVRQTAAIGASSSLPDTPAKVPSPNPQPPHALGSGDCAVIATGAC